MRSAVQRRSAPLHTRQLRTPGQRTSTHTHKSTHHTFLSLRPRPQPSASSLPPLFSPSRRPRPPHRCSPTTTRPPTPATVLSPLPCTSAASLLSTMTAPSLPVLPSSPSLPCAHSLPRKSRRRHRHHTAASLSTPSYCFQQSVTTSVTGETREVDALALPSRVLRLFPPLSPPFRVGFAAQPDAVVDDPPTAVLLLLSSR